MMKKNRCLWIFLWLSYSALASGEVSFVPRVEVGHTSFGLTFSGDPILVNGTSVNLSNELNWQVYALRLGVTVAYNNIYFDSYFQTTSSDTSVQAIPEFNTVEVWTAQKDDIYLTFGYSVSEAVNLFVGYRDLVIEGDGIGTSEYKFSDDGFFFGGSYRWIISDTGSLSVNIAYAFLDSKLEETLGSQRLPDGEGDGDGLKFGVAWQDQLSENLIYILGIDYFDYEYDLELDTENEKSEVTLAENEITAKLGLVLLF